MLYKDLLPRFQIAPRLAALSLLALSALLPLQVSAQTRALPKAGFSNYSGSGNQLPSAGGLSLQEGMDRPRNAPAEVYNPGEPSLNHKLVRWESRFMPLKVWISPGKKLKDEPISMINQGRPQEVLALLRSDPSLSSLQQCASWAPEMNSAASSGIEQWKEFQNEGLFSFEFVDDPTLANILLFWTDAFTGDEGAGGVSTGGNTVAVLYDANEVKAKEAAAGQPLQGTPVVIELRAADSFDRLQARAAHEFGHALGIKEHSPYNQDLMCVNGIAKQLSPSDKATIRWLYHQRTPLVMLPPVIPRGGSTAGWPQASSPPRQGGGGSSNPWPNASAGGGQPPSYGASQDESPAPRAGGGYRIPTSRPIKKAADGVDDEGEYSSAAPPRREYTPLRESEKEKTKTARETGEREKERKPERKSKKDKEPGAAPKYPAPQADSLPPEEKASDGY